MGERLLIYGRASAHWLKRKIDYPNQATQSETDLHTHTHTHTQADSLDRRLCT